LARSFLAYMRESAKRNKLVNERSDSGESAGAGTVWFRTRAAL
jgi:hypothetical protein